GGKERREHVGCSSEARLTARLRSGPARWALSCGCAMTACQRTCRASSTPLACGTLETLASVACGKPGPELELGTASRACGACSGQDAPRRSPCRGAPTSAGPLDRSGRCCRHTPSPAWGDR